MVSNYLFSVVRAPVFIGLICLVIAACGGGPRAASTPSTPPVNDTTAPVLTLTGEASITHELGTVFTDPGWTVTDNVDSSLNVLVEGEVDSDVAGEYTLTYTVADSAGNTASAERTVTVESSTPALVVFKTGATDSAWDDGIGAYDAGISYGTCVGDGGASCPNISWALSADSDRGNVLQVSHSSAGADTGLFFQASTPIDASAYAGGNIVFDLQVISGDSNFSIKVDCVYPCTSGAKSLGSHGATGWETVSVAVNDLVAGGLDLSKISTGLVIWATQQTNTIFQLDNIRWEMGDGTQTGTGTGTGTVTNATSPLSYDGYSLVWNDEFNGSTLNSSNWTHEIGDGCNNNLCGWGNNELEYYRSENSTVADGLLTITSKQENFGGRDYTSSRLKTQGKQFFTYGRVDIRAKLPKGQGIWPALWMLGESITTVSWPASGELDIMEMIGGTINREKTTHGTIHYSNAAGGREYTGGSTTVENGLLADAFHVFSIDWNTTSITWSLDGVAFHSQQITSSDRTEFHENFFFLFNVAVGGEWPGSPNADTQFPQQMQVDYIRVFQLD